MVLKIPYFAKLRKKTIFSSIFLQNTSFMRNRVGNIIFRYVVASVGLFMIAFAIALAIKSNLGTAPLSCVAYVLNLDIPGISVGAFTFLVNMVYILVQLAVLRKRFKLVSLMQVVASVVFGYMIDASLWMLGWLEPAGFGVRLLLILAAAAITALGTSIEVAADAWMVSAEMTVAAFSSTFGKEFGKVKMVMDSSMVVISAVLAFIFFGNFFGSGEFTGLADVLLARTPGVVIGLGTLLMAFLPGYLMRFTDRLVAKVSGGAPM